jgi:hypothetical protein
MLSHTFHLCRADTHQLRLPGPGPPNPAQVASPVKTPRPEEPSSPDHIKAILALEAPMSPMMRTPYHVAYMVVDPGDLAMYTPTFKVREPDSSISQ